MYVDSAIFIVGLKIEDDPWALLTPFEWEVWMGLLLIAPIFCCFAGVIDLAYTGHANWSSLAYFTYAVMLNQITNISEQKRWYKRTATIVWVWACLVFTTCYSGTEPECFRLNDSKLDPR